MTQTIKSPKRAISGILLIDKPGALTSNAVLQIVKKTVGAQKAGHTGSLDPLATGMLPICFGQATKIVRFLLDADKSYQLKMSLGSTTTTGDADGEMIVRRPIPQLSPSELESILAEFRGEIQQIPPIYSALKQNGKRFYELARQGRGDEIEKKARTQHIRELKLCDYEYQDAHTAYLNLRVRCNKGTYMRSLSEDIGAKMGCGAHVLELRRLSVNPFEGQPMITLDQLKALDIKELDNLLLATELAIPHIPKMRVSQAFYADLNLGRQVPNERADPLHRGWVQLWHESTGEFFGIGEALESGLIAPKRIFNNA